MIILVSIAVLLSTLLGGIFAIKFKDKLHLILGFSAGAVIGVAFFDLIPESIELASGNYGIKFIMTLIAIGFSAFLVIDRFFSIHTHTDECHKPDHRGKIAASALLIHSFLDGLGIGLAFKVSSAVGLIVMTAVLVHDFSDGINTVNLVLKGNSKTKEAFKWLILDSLAPVVGIITSNYITVSRSQLGIILAIFAGMFFYIGASDLVPESHHNHPTIWTTLMTLLGILVLYLAIHFAS